jgi:hypothetical protein
MGTPLAQSSVKWQRDVQQLAPAQAMSPMQQMQNAQVDQSVMQR